jgi:hypothetical protein
MKDLGRLGCFLGIEVAYLKRDIFICQRIYEINLIKETNKFGCKPNR